MGSRLAASLKLKVPEEAAGADFTLSELRAMPNPLHRRSQAAMCSCRLELNQPTQCPARMLKASGQRTVSDFAQISPRFRKCLGMRLGSSTQVR